MLWHHLRDRRLAGVKFKRQQPIVGFIVDFIALDLKLIIEVDGGQHDWRRDEDTARTAILEKCGYHVIRFWNNDVLGNIEGVIETLLQELTILRGAPSPQPSPRWGEGAPPHMPRAQSANRNDE
ncbi:MAG: endonuclease domain-containing protein [Variibacter sp.]